MNLVALAVSLTLAAAPAVEASEGATSAPLKLKPKSAIAAAAPSANRPAPFVEPLAEPELALIPREDSRLETSRSSCAGERSLCYDTQSGRIVYKPARAFMPDLPGLQRENISVKRDRIVLRYSF
jgi:hypothetical protein